MEVGYSKKKAAVDRGEAKFDAVQLENSASRRGLRWHGRGGPPQCVGKEQVESLAQGRSTATSAKSTSRPSCGGLGQPGVLRPHSQRETRIHLVQADGEPLRAKVALILSGSPARRKRSRKKNVSPGPTHGAGQAGDTLPLLCERIYRSPLYHHEWRVSTACHAAPAGTGHSLRFPPLA